MAARNLEDIYALSPLQEGMLFHSLYAPESGVYIEQLSCALDGPLDESAFARAWARVIERHAVLRTAFVWKSQKRPLQAVQRTVELPLRSEDWSAEDGPEREARFAAFLAADRRQGFALARAPLMRLALLRFGAASHRLVWTSHHLLIDGWSLPLLLAEVLGFYAAFAAGGEPALPAPRPYREYIAWLAQQDLGAAETFFRRELAGFDEPTEIALPRPSRGELAAAADDGVLMLDRGEHERLAELARRHRLTLSTVVQGAWAALLGRYAGDRGGSDDVVFGTTVSGRSAPLPGIESMIGLFINTLPVRVRLPARAAVAPWLADLQERQLALQAYEPTPLARIQSWSELQPGTPLATTLFVYENYPTVPLAPAGGLALSAMDFRERTNFPLTAIVVPAGENLTLRLAFDPARLDAPAAGRMVGHWANLLASLGDGLAAGGAVEDLALLSPAERLQLASGWNPPAAELPRTTLAARFAAQAARMPGAIALSAPEGELTYRELAGRAARFAAVLRRHGVGPESLVAVCLERSLDLVVALLAVVEAGGAYVPLDPAYPRERLAFMLADSAASVLVARGELAARLPAHGAVLVTPDDAPASAEPLGHGSVRVPDPDPALDPDNLAYVLYTSGSTGRPKGVAVTHADVSRLLAATEPLCRFGAGDVWTLFHSFAFDFSVWEMWGALAHGGRLVVVPYAVSRSPDELVALLQAERVTVLNQTPSSFAQLAPAALRAGAELADLRLVIFGGEALDPASLAGWLAVYGERRPRLVNMYGITETTVHVTWRPIGSVDLASAASPIGRPLADLQVHLLDPRGRLVPPGIPGEMHVGGAGLARGYLGRPGLTAERFVPDGFAGDKSAPGGRLYRTGDLARRRPDGELEFLGRADRQVKIRGHRVELGEIEAALAACPGVRAAAVEVRVRDGSRRLVAYVAGDAALRPAELRAHLAATLPEPMLPAAFVRLHALPLTPNGKVDRRALAELAAAEETAASAGGAEPLAPRGAVEELLAGIWAEVLRLPRVGVGDNFFTLGGDSILSLQVVSRASQAGCRITPRQLFEHPTVAGLAAAAVAAELAAAAASSAKGATVETAAQGAVTGDVPLTPIQRWFLDQEPADPHHFNQAILLAVRPPLAPAAVERGLAALLVHHDALRLRFQREASGWRQWSAAPAPGSAAPLVQVDLSALPAERAPGTLTAAAAAAQASLDLGEGPLLRALWMALPGGERRLLLAVHHLAVDGVSWRVILEDLATACRAVVPRTDRGAAPALPPKTTSFKRWAQHLVEQALTADREAELAFWLSQTVPATAETPAGWVDDRVADAASVAVELSAADTAELLRALPAAYGAGASIADALVAALAATLAPPGGAAQVDLEGHGREETSGDGERRGLDLSRTVGWFTSIYPLLLAPGDDPRPGAVLAAVRRQLAAVPSRGLGFGLLRYLGARRPAALLAARAASPVSFNYLGQLDAVLPAGTLFAPAAEPIGPAQSPRARRSHPLAINAFVAAGRLQSTWSYGASRFSRDEIERLAERFAAHLRDLAAHARAVAAGEVPGEVPADSDEVSGDSWQPGDSRALAPVDAAIRARLGEDFEDAYPLTPLQEGLVFHSLLAPGAGEYVEQLRADFAGELDVAAFRGAWERIVARTPILRTSFHGVGGGDGERPLQAVHRRVELAIVEQDWRGMVADESERRFAELARADRCRGFDLGRPPLMRWTLVRGEGGWRFLWSHHHALLDGWSYAALIGDFAVAYEALAGGGEPALRTRPPYRDFIAWLAERDPAADDDFFRAALGGFTAPTPLAADRPPGAAPVMEDAVLRLGVAATAALRAAARAAGLTASTLAQGAWALLLGRLAASDDVVFGATVAGRPPELPGVEAMIGLFINTLPVRVRLAGSMGGESAAVWLARLQAEQAALRQHEPAPLVRVQGVSEVPRGTQLFESMLVVENYPHEAALRGSALGRQITGFQAIEQTHYPLSLAVVPGEDLVLRLGYDRSRFDRTTVLRRLGHLGRALAGLAAALASGTGLAEIELLADAERQQALVEWNDTAVSYPAAASLQTLFEERVRAAPGAEAVRFGTVSWTYAELDARANRLARRLRALGVGPESRIGIAAERGAELVAAMLAVIKAGGAYVPLDPELPAERRAYLLADSRVRTLVARDAPAGFAGEVVALAEADFTSGAFEPLPLPVSTDGGSLAYVVYTSGSTGDPKGIEIPHRAVARLVLGADYVPLAPGDSVLQAANASFDAITWEVWGPLLTGGTIVGVEREALLTPGALGNALAGGGVTAAFLTTALFHRVALDDPGAFGALRHLLVGGEAVDPRRLREVLASGAPPGRLLDVYGPTESTTFATWHRLAAMPAVESAVPVGRPIANTRLYVLDARQRPVPLGGIGELALGGDGLARAYAGRPGQTARSFLPDPFADSAPAGARLYRTGDLARLRADGVCELLGRIDSQVKLRGFRIELGEIEARLLEHPAVAAAAVLLREDAPGDRRLVAYVVVDRGQLQPEGGGAGGGVPRLAAPELRSFLAARLPDYMLPAVFVELAALPITATGKIDRRRLPAPAAEGAPAAGASPPRTATERQIAAIWFDLLGSPTGALPAVDDDFFVLGGHSLLATQVISRVRRELAVEVPLRALFERPTVGELAAEVDRLRADAGPEPLAAPPILPVPRDRPLPLSFAQERLWLLDRLDPRGGLGLYDEPAAFRLRGDLDLAAFAAAVAAVVARHEALRTTFAEEGGRAVQRIAAPAPFPLPLVDLSALAAGRREAEAPRLAGRAGGGRRFDLARGPLARCLVARLSPRDHAVLFSFHHIAFDGWSVGIFVRELSACYRAAVEGRPAALPALAIQYADFAVWQREWLAGEVLARELAHWRQRLAGAPEMELPADRPAPALRSGRGESLVAPLPRAVADRLHAVAAASGATPFMVLLAGFLALLARHGGGEDIVIGAPIANRSRGEIEGLIGFFVNLLALRVDLGGEPTFAALVERVRQVALDAFAHQDLPFERLIGELAPARSPARNPLFQTSFQLFPVGGERLELPGLEAVPFPAAARAEKFGLSFAWLADGGDLAGRLEVDPDLFDRSTAARLAERYLRLLAAAVAVPEEQLSALPLASAAERHQLLVEWSAEEDSPAPGETLAGLVARQAALRPDAVAIESGAGEAPGGSLTYGALAARAGRLARALEGAGVGPDVVVGLCLPRSPELYLAALAVVLAGGAYLPLDAELPSERLAFMAAAAGAAAILTCEASLGRLEALDAALALAGGAGGRCPILTLESLAGGLTPAGLVADAEGPVSRHLDPDHLVYVMYTSGSTGRPKGVAVTHRAVARLVAGCVAFGAAQVGVALAPFSFDASTAEVWGTLANGARLVVPAPGALAPAEIAALVARHGISVMWLTAGLFHQTVEQVVERSPELLASLARLLVGGDALSPDLTARAVAALPSTLVIAGYGPTENTTFTACAPLATPAAVGGTVPLGRPIAGSRAVVLDLAGGGPAPLGAMGELHAGGDGLARGYAGRPDLTAAAFVPDAAAALRGAPGARLYRTGDLARHLADGRLEFLGRVDRQVKLRGFRIEPGEIEAALASHPGVRQAAVLARRERGDLRLVAYVETAGPAGPAELRAHLRRRLPEHMVPSLIVALAALPLTANGKVDRAALERSLPGSVELPPAGAAARRRTPPRNPSEELLAAIWSEVLAVDGVGVEDDFFALSGHSLLATQVAFRVREAFGVELPLVRLFERATLGELAAEIDAAGEGRSGLPPLPPITAAPAGSRLPASFLQEWALDLQGGPISAAMNMPFALRLRGPLALGALAGALGEIWRRHDVLRTTFRAEAGELVQVVAPPAAAGGGPALPLLDLAGLPAPRRESLLHALAAADARRPFDVERGPLFSLTAVRLGGLDHALLLNMHHAIGDGWSIEVFEGELTALYAAWVRGAPSPLPPPELQFGDFAWWQRHTFAGPALAAQLDHWRAVLADRPPALDIPADRPRPPVLGPATVAGAFAVHGEALAGLRAAARAAGCTVSMALTAALQALLHCYTGAVDILVGTLVSGRHRRELAPLLGMFMNSVTVRTDLSGNPTLRELMQRVRAAVLDAYRHQDVPFPALLAALYPRQRHHRTLMFRAAFNMQNFSAGSRPPDAAGGGPLAELAIESFDEAEEPAKYDLLVAGREDVDRLFCRLTGAADLFDPATITALCRDYEEVIAGIAADPEARLERLLPDPHHRLAAGARERRLGAYGTTAVAHADGRERTDPWNP